MGMGVRRSFKSGTRKKKYYKVAIRNKKKQNKIDENKIANVKVGNGRWKGNDFFSWYSIYIDSKVKV